MSREKSLEEAIELFEKMAHDVFTLTERVNLLEKEGIRSDAKLDSILEALKQRKDGQNLWLPFTITSLLSLATLAIMILKP